MGQFFTELSHQFFANDLADQKLHRPVSDFVGAEQVGSLGHSPCDFGPQYIEPLVAKRRYRYDLFEFVFLP